MIQRTHVSHHACYSYLELCNKSSQFSDLKPSIAHNSTIWAALSWVACLCSMSFLGSFMHFSVNWQTDWGWRIQDGSTHSSGTSTLRAHHHLPTRASPPIGPLMLKEASLSFFTWQATRAWKWTLSQNLYNVISTEWFQPKEVIRPAQVQFRKVWLNGTTLTI